MASSTDYLEDKLRDHVLLNTAYTSPTTVYVALFTTPTTDAGGGTEVTGGSYARQPCAFTAGAAGTGEASNTSAVTFPGMPGVTVSHSAIYDQVTAGNMLLHNALIEPKVVVATTSLTFAAGDIDVSFG